MLQRSWQVCHQKNIRFDCNNIFSCLFTGSWCTLRTRGLVTFDLMGIKDRLKPRCTYTLTENKKGSYRVEAQIKPNNQRVFRFVTRLNKLQQIDFTSDLKVKVNRLPVKLPYRLSLGNVRIEAEARMWHRKVLYLRFVKVSLLIT